jgi:hypothetical protein
MKKKCEVKNIIVDSEESYNEDSTETMKISDSEGENNLINKNMALLGLNGNRKRHKIISTYSEDSIDENINIFGTIPTSLSW